MMLNFMKLEVTYLLLKKMSLMCSLSIRLILQFISNDCFVVVDIDDFDSYVKL